jgi:hypothetical protein
MSFATNAQLKHETSHLVSAAFERLIQSAKQLLHGIADGFYETQNFDQVRELLATVPLTTGEHAWAVTRLKNAMEYAGQCEIGGACYELTLLVRKLTNCQQLSQT